jgi:hypothetical protein
MFYSQCRPHPLSRNEFDLQVTTRLENKTRRRSNQQRVKGLQSLSRCTSKSYPVHRVKFVTSMPIGTSTEPKFAQHSLFTSYSQRPAFSPSSVVENKEDSPRAASKNSIRSINKFSCRLQSLLDCCRTYITAVWSYVFGLSQAPFTPQNLAPRRLKTDTHNKANDASYKNPPRPSDRRPTRRKPAAEVPINPAQAALTK